MKLINLHINGYKNLKSKGGNLKIVNVSNTIMELFSMTGMADYLDIEQG